MPPLRIAPAITMNASPRYSTTGIDAEGIAMGLLQICTLPSGPWNDPTAPGLGAVEREMIVEQWDVGSRTDWLRMIDFLSIERRRRHAWMIHLSARNQRAATLGRPPRTQEWLAGIDHEGGDVSDARPFVAGLELIEREVRRSVGEDLIAPHLFVRTLDGYALGQAVAMTTWGVALGYADIAEARQIIHRISTEARPSFESWADFGLSYLAGRIMHWSDGTVDETAIAKFGDGWRDLKTALSSRRGPWAALPWGTTQNLSTSRRTG